MFQSSQFFIGDLGSASVVTDLSGVTVGEQRYYAYGETRLSTGSMYTDKLFTGQREITGLGIYHYGARFYSPKLGRFLSADTIVPSYTNPQHLNRYMYVLGNPLKYTDPTGHNEDCGIGEACQTGHSNPNDPAPTATPPDDDPIPDPNAGGGGKPLYLINAQTANVSCNGGDSNVSCTLYGDALHLQYYGQSIVINLANINPKDLAELNFLVDQFSSLVTTK